MASPFFIVGPTAVGKTGIALAVAERCGAEIVNADAFQVYAGLDLLTAKPTREERGRVAHHLVGTVPLGEAYNVARYQQEAQDCLDAIARRQRPALVVGGSGMYVKSLTHGLSPLPPAQPVLRAELEALDLAALRRRLEILDPATARSIDRANKRRLVRAIEVCEVTGKPFSEFREPWYSPGTTPGAAGVFLMRSKADLDARIKRRVEWMFAHGAVEEVQALPPAAMAGTAARMIGLGQIQDHLAGRLNRAECMQKIETATRQYAKRQITWFKRESTFETLYLTGEDDEAHAVARICERVTGQAIPEPEGALAFDA